MRIFDVMTEGVRTISPTVSAEAARETMRLHGIHHLVVADKSDVVGVVSTRDLGRPGSARERESSVADIMSTPAVTVDREMPLRKAANMMRGRFIGCLVVMKGRRPVGIVTVSDLLDVIGRGGDRQPRAAAPSGVQYRAHHRKRPAGGIW